MRGPLFAAALGPPAIAAVSKAPSSVWMYAVRWQKTLRQFFCHFRRHDLPIAVLADSALAFWRPLRGGEGPPRSTAAACRASRHLPQPEPEISWRAVIWPDWCRCACRGARVQARASSKVYLRIVCTCSVLGLAASRLGRLRIEFMASYHSHHRTRLSHVHST